MRDYWIVIRWLVVSWLILMVNAYAIIIGMYFTGPGPRLYSAAVGAIGGGCLAWWWFWTNRQPHL